MNRYDVESYFAMASDLDRTLFYKAALESICRGKVVCDLGAGTGILSMLALQAGASRVYAVEADRDALDVAIRVAADNGFGSRFVPVYGVSTKVELLERADVLVAEVFDSTGIGENGPSYMVDAVRRLCVSDPVVIPERLVCFLALGTSTTRQERLWGWNRLGKSLGLNLRSAGLAPVGEPSEVIPLTEWQTWQRISLGRESHESRMLVPFVALRDGLVEGLCCTFQLEAGLLQLSTLKNVGTHWKTSFYPLPKPIAVEEGDRLFVELAFAPSDAPKLRFGWSVRKYAAGAPVEDGLEEVVEARVIRFDESGRVELVRLEEPRS